MASPRAHIGDPHHTHAATPQAASGAAGPGVGRSRRAQARHRGTWIACAFALVGACGSPAPPHADADADAPVAAARAPAPRARKVTILFTTGRRGQLEESGCRRDPLGGIARQATWLGTDPLAGDPRQRLLLDGGDAFLPSPPEAPTEAQRAAAALVADLYDVLHYDVVALAPRDLDLGADALLAMSRSHRFAVSSANVFAQDDDRPPFQQGLLFAIDGVKVGVVGVVDAAHGAQNDSHVGPWRYREPIVMVRDQVKRMRARGAEVVVVMAQLRDEEIKTVANLPGVDLVLQGSGPEEALPLRQQGQRGWVVYPGGRGENVAVIELTLPPGANAPLSFADGNAAERLQDRIARVDERIERILDAGRPSAADAVAPLRAQRGLLALDLEKVTAPPAGQPQIHYHLAPIRLAIPEEPEVAGRVDTLLGKVPTAPVPPPQAPPSAQEHP